MNKIFEYECVKIEYNKYMGNEIFSDNNTVIYFDNDNLVKVGDKIKIEKDENYLYKRIWVNDVLIIDKITMEEQAEIDFKKWQMKIEG